MGYFQDGEFQERIIALMVRDQKFLSKMSGILTFEDFEPQETDGLEGKARQWLATTALQYWREYSQPIGGMLRTEALDYIRENRLKMGQKYRQKLLEMVEKVRDPELAVAVESLEKKIRQYKQRQKFKMTIQKLIELQGKGTLNPSTFRQVTNEAIVSDELNQVTDYGETLEERIKRRSLERERKLPSLYIECFDEHVSTAPRGQVAIALAKYGTGKSVFMVHVAKAYAMQGYNVLFFTLEDPVPMVENRLDASLGEIPLLRLDQYPNKLRNRFYSEWEQMRAKIMIVNATGGGWTVHRMAEFWETMRNRNFIADLVIVDYDKKIEPTIRYKGDSAERMHSSEIYIELTNWAARDQIFMWVAAQARRGKKDERQIIVTGDDAAEDINKLRESALCLGIGFGPEKQLGRNDNHRFIYVAKHRFDRSMMGWPIEGDFTKGIFYLSDPSRELLERYNKVMEKKKGN